MGRRTHLRAITTLLLLMASVLSPVASTAAENCHAWTGADWDHYLDSALGALAQSVQKQQDYSQEIRGNSVKAAFAKISETIAGCQDDIAKFKLAGCLDRFVGFRAQFQVTKKDHMYSAIMTDEQYLASRPPEALAFPPDLRDPTHVIPKNWKEICAKNGWPWIQFQSRTADESRLVIYIPEGKNYRIVMATHDYPYRTDPSNYLDVQMQYVQLEKDGKPLAHPIDNFSYWLPFDGWKPGRPLDLGPAANIEGAGRCVTCHMNGPRNIVPVPDDHFDDGSGKGYTMSPGTTLADFTKKFLVQGRTTDLSSNYDMKHIPQQLALGNSCQDCHNGSGHTTLAMHLDYDGAFSTTQIDRKVVDEKSMPLGEPMTDEQRTGERRVIESQFYSGLKNWLTATKCSNAAAGAVDGAPAPANGGTPADPAGP